MARKKYDAGKIIAPIIAVIFFLFLSFPVFINPRLSWLAVYVFENEKEAKEEINSPKSSVTKKNPYFPNTFKLAVDINLGDYIIQ